MVIKRERKREGGCNALGEKEDKILIDVEKLMLKLLNLTLTVLSSLQWPFCYSFVSPTSVLRLPRAVHLTLNTFLSGVFIVYPVGVIRLNKN